MKKQFIQCGKIVSTHGVRGELKVLPWTNQPQHLLEFSRFYLADGSQLTVTGSRIHKNMLLLTVEGISTLEEARNYRGQILSLNREDDPDDAPYLVDFIGVRVTDQDTGQDYGVITEVIQTGANDVYVLLDDENVERLIPDIPQVVLETDLDAQTMKIRPLKGLFDDEN